MNERVQAIFDIGKTNKKFFLFDKEGREVHMESIQFEEKKDEDGFPCDNLEGIEKWCKETFFKTLEDDRFDIQTLNFSTYGASFIHLGEDGNPVAPLYNYLKPFPKTVLEDFYREYGDALKVAKETASPPLGMLNSGLQLYWLKYAKPNTFSQIKWSLHLPQYISYLFSGKKVSEYTSIGCHTALWEYSKNDYHDWIYEEGIDKILPSIVQTNEWEEITFNEKKIKVGVGIHDSSAALLPYLKQEKTPFLLVSTGTWSIVLNPFNEELLSEEDLKNDCLNFLRIDGQKVKASRLFLGNEHAIQLEKLKRHFKRDKEKNFETSFNEEIINKLQLNYRSCYRFESIHLNRKAPVTTDLSIFSSFEEAYHQLMLELVELQIESIDRAIGNTFIEKIYLDGGFVKNAIYVELLKRYFYDKQFEVRQIPLGSALGASLLI